ncbi:HAMP domain-containing protein [Luteimonas sp. MC1572]|uniref:HAMP domain-containing protein n=1 Tax=Luteimonas sp. MC1572 TaxID=2799325 RepID=UPI0018F0AD93|nr:HAMP domain-containing protein [Luteimonas sp. MC1572]MBJ6982775.1 HAMP domain-containing protein [Luteimonas sp. MC1572]QQO04011.1 HAMP domain-containing protein [Luteimonas sp. MC1572]
MTQTTQGRRSAPGGDIAVDDAGDPMRMMLSALQAVAQGDFSVELPGHWEGLEGRLADAFNAVVRGNRGLAHELARVGQKVGREGLTRQRIALPNRHGCWGDMEDSVNELVDDLVRPVATITEAIAGVAKGDLTRSVPLEADGRQLQGEFMRSATIVNRMIEQMGEFSSEVTRVALEVGTAGRLGGQAKVEGVSGVWKELTDSVNQMASNLTAQVRNISEVTIAVANGDLSRKITVDVRGEILQLKEAINTMVDQLRGFASEVTRVAREVGTEGKLGGQAIVPGVAGTWKDLTDSVNAMASNLTSQVRNIAEVTTAVARGDLSRKITVDVRGEIAQLKDTINTMVDQLNGFAAEVTRVAREVGTEGKLGGQAQVPDVAGTWKDLTDHVNSMASNLTSQVRNIAEVTTAVAKGDLSRKITVDVRGEIAELKDTINTMVDQLNSFAAEVTRVAREVGTEGKLGGQAQVPGVDGTWADLTDSVNAMASNLTSQVRNIAEVTTAVAKGDLSRKIAVDAQGEILQLKDTINTMVDQLNGFAAEVTRVAREVGTEGKLGGQAQVPGVAGTWKDLTDNVNSMATNLTTQVRNIAEVTTAVAKGDLSRKIAVDAQGEILQLKDTINTMVDQLNGFAAEVTRVAREVGTEGKLGGQAQVPGVAGTWKDLTDNVNSMATNLTTQVRNIAEVATSVAKGDLSRKIAVDAQGEILQLKDTLNTMVDQLNGFAAEVTRVAREVGTEGKLGGQAQVPGVAGTWKDLTDNVNSMATNLTAQVRGIAKVVTAVATGDLQQKLTVEAKGEIAELADTINGMTDTLAIFADQVTTVAREVGVEGRLGGQANVPGTAGIWKNLTANVNQLAANLTTQVRAIAEVATAVTQGDLTRSITVDVRGELADLKDNMNLMIGTLRATTESNSEQDWLKTNLAKFSGMMQGQRDLLTLGQMLLSELALLVDAQQGLIYVVEADDASHHPRLRQLARYADAPGAPHPGTLAFGEGLVGQCAAEGRLILIEDVPPGSVQIASGLLSAVPKSVIVLPVLFEKQVKAVLELASLSGFTPSQRIFLEQLSGSIGIVLNTIESTMRTERLLSQSQQLAGELQVQQDELQQTNEEIALKAQMLAEQKAEVEQKNQQIEHARRELEEKAAELALTSRYKSEFLANMSHELRTPLNSILILGQQLAENPEANLSGRQVEFAKTIHAAGTDLLNLISDILDLSKIESGTVTVDSEAVRFAHLRDNLMRAFRHEAERRDLEFTIELDPALGPVLSTDPKRLQQILKNLLSNAFKFTQQGSVRMRAYKATAGWSHEHDVLVDAGTVVAIEVSDTGIGISADKQRIVFEAFQQADSGTARQFGGTGLGLAISREIAGLLGGELTLQSEPGTGSTFTLYLPLHYAGADRAHSVRAAQALRGPSGAVEAPVAAPEAVADDRDFEADGAPVLLLVEDDARYATVLRDLARKQGFHVLVAGSGAEALQLVHACQPTAICLDIFLPDMLGWTLLARLKQDAGTRHIPVQILTIEEGRHQSLERGAFAYLAKPATTQTIDASLQRMREYALPRVKRLLVVEDDTNERLGIEALIGHDDVAIDTVDSGEAALTALAGGAYDCAVVDLRLPDMDGFELLDRIQEQPQLRDLPIVVFTGKELSAEEMQRLRHAAKSVVLKDVESPERLLDETALFLHRVIAHLPPDKRRMVERLHASDEVLADKRVLVVDDDVRNIFAMSSVLERHGMDVITAANGQEAVEKVAGDSTIGLVLMDIMMPGMDGYETMRAIRRLPESRALPIVAITAKAMKGDREKCLEAGASDYLAKPVVTDELLGVLRQWLHR